MDTIIAGSRTIHNIAHVMAAIAHCPWKSLITEVVCGESKEQVERYIAGKRKGNPDIFGAVWAINNGIPVAYFPAEWSGIGYGDPAGPIRNGKMAKYARALILVWNLKSRGSANMLQQAMQTGYLSENIFQWEVKDG